MYFITTKNKIKFNKCYLYRTYFQIKRLKVSYSQNILNSNIIC